MGSKDAQAAKTVQKKGDKPGAGGKSWSDSDVSKGYKVLGKDNPQSNPQKAQNIKTGK
jgi:hypothetical protein